MDNLNDFLMSEVDEAINGINKIELEFHNIVSILDKIDLESHLPKYNQTNKNNIILRNNLIDNTLDKLKNTFTLIQSEIKDFDFQLIHSMDESELKRQINNINTDLSVILEKLKTQNKEINEKINETNLVVINISQENKNKILTKITESFFEYKDDLYGSLINVFSLIEQIFQLIKYLNQTNSKIQVNVSENFSKKMSLILKKYENNFFSITEKFENELKIFKLDLEKVSHTSNLLNKEVDEGLNNINDLTKKIQKVELEFSKLLSSQNNFIKDELEKTKLRLLENIEDIIKEAKNKLNQIDDHEAKIKNSHSDFIKLVEQAGIYELTQNYKDKAEDEKIEYKTFRKYTTWSILAAVGFTLAVFIFAFFENSGNTNHPNYLILISRLSISAMFFILALYLSKQAAKHYESYQENHRTFLQLAALEPFMARMNEDEQKEIRKGLIPSYFNQNVDGKFTVKGDEVDLPANIHAIVNRAFDVLSERKEQNHKPTSE
ncbi:hypothetical protein A9Z54_16085 [Acinetobacter sp. 51m]|nr:hypothetical protein A9Z54_16085 [Acinetobacter sp. 51m]